MNKKSVISLFIAFSIIAGIWIGHPSSPNFDLHCPFCDQTILDRQKFYEDDLVLALYTHRPVFPGHCLVIPKRHVERFELLTEDEITEIGQTLKKVNDAVVKVFGTSAYLILQKNGKEVGQSVPHLHFHYIPRKAGDASQLKYIFKMYLSILMPPLSPDEMQKVIEELKEAI
jgi:histidine triad (HIT) family protein